MNISQEKYRRDYILIKVMYEDIHYQMQQFVKGKNTNEKLIALKYAMIPLNQVLDHRKTLAKYVIDIPELKKYDKLYKHLDFFKHVRNKLSGHLDNDVVRMASEWEPHIFHPKCKDDKELQLFTILKSLFETSINSYKGQGTQQLFQKEIDILVDERLLIDTIVRVMEDTLNYLCDIMLYIDNKKIEYEAFIEDIMKASMVDFKQLGNKRHK